MYKYAKKKKKRIKFISMLGFYVGQLSGGGFYLPRPTWLLGGLFHPGLVSLECLRDVYRKMPWRQLSRRLRKGFRLMYSWVGELTPGRGERREEDFHENLWNANMWGLRRENGAHTGIWEETARSAGTKKKWAHDIKKCKSRNNFMKMWVVYGVKLAER